MTTAQMPDSTERETLARIAPHFGAIMDSATCARLSSELPALEETAQVLESVAALARDGALSDPLNRNKNLASFRLTKEANDAARALSEVKSAYCAAAIEAILAVPIITSAGS